MHVRRLETGRHKRRGHESHGAIENKRAVPEKIGEARADGYNRHRM